MSDVTQPNESGLTRRDLLKSGAILGGALAWGAPVVQMIGMRPAMAQAVSGCPNLYCIKGEPRDGDEITGDPAQIIDWVNCSQGSQGGRGNCLDLGDDFEDATLAPSGILTGIVVEPADCDGVPGIRVTLPATCRFAIDEANQQDSPDAFLNNLSAAVKCGNKGGVPCYGAGDTGIHPSDHPLYPNQTWVCFPLRCGNDTGISHVELIICCD